MTVACMLEQTVALVVTVAQDTTWVETLHLGAAMGTSVGTATESVLAASGHDNGCFVPMMVEATIGKMCVQLLIDMGVGMLLIHATTVE